MPRSRRAAIVVLPLLGSILAIWWSVATVESPMLTARPESASAVPPDAPLQHATLPDAIDARSLVAMKPSISGVPSPTASGTPPLPTLALGGRVVDAQGQPITTRRFTGTLFLDDVELAEEFVTDAAGRFLVALAAEYVGASCRVVNLRASESGLAWPPRIPQLQPGHNDLGDVVFALPAELVRVRLTGGEPEGDPTLGLMVVHADPTAPPETKMYGNRDVLVRRLDARHFAIHGHPSLAWLRIDVRSRRHVLRHPVRVELPSAHEVELELLVSGALEASVLADDDRLLVSVRLGALALDRETGSDTRHVFAEGTEPLAGDRRFRWKVLAPGRYRVEVSVGMARPSVTIEGVVVEPGTTARDARLQNIDLRGQFRRMTLRLRDEAGKPLSARPLYGVRGPDGEPARAAHWVGQDMTLHVLTAEPWIAVGMTAPGHRPVFLPRVDHDREVVFTPGPRLRIAVSGTATLPAEHRLVAVVHASRTVPGEPSPAQLFPQYHVELDERGCAATQLSRGGELRVEVAVLAVGSGRLRPVGSARTFVPEAASVHDVVVPLDADLWTKALAHTRR